MGKGKKRHSKKGPKHHAPKQNGESLENISSYNCSILESNEDANPMLHNSNKHLDACKQRKIIERLFDQANQQGLQVGDKRFVLSAKWWKGWCDFVGYDGKKHAPVAGVDDIAPGRIDNLPLLFVSSNTPLDELMGGPMLPRLEENHHYVLIPLEVWDALRIWYGGGPTIARFVESVEGPKLDSFLNFVQLYPEKGKELEKLTNGSINSSNEETKELKEEMADAIGAKQVVLPNVVVTSSSIPKVCGACRKSSGLFKRCGSCRLVWYCGASCQTSHWKYHKVICCSANSAHEKEGGILRDLQAERRGKMGLRNLGNTCFMNSALQCLSHVDLLTRYFLSNKYKKDLNRDNPLGTGGNLAEEYDALLKELWFGSGSNTSPANLKGAISRFAPQFSGFQQHDAQELFAFIIDGLHEDLNRVKHKPYTEVKESDGSQDDAAVAEEAWKRHLLRNDSIFVDHIQGQFKSTVVCPVCDKVSITFDPFNCIQLELPRQLYREIEVIFVSSDTAQLMNRYLIEVPKKGSVLLLKRALSKLCGVSPKSILAADIYQSMVYRLIGDTERLDRLREDDRILMYQLPHMPAEDAPLYGFLYNRVGPTLTGDPLLFTYTASTKCSEILEKWSELLSSHISRRSRSVISATMLSQCVYLTDRDGVLLRNEPIPLAIDSKFIDFASLPDEDAHKKPVFFKFVWSSSMLSSFSLRPEMDRIRNHESMRVKLNGSRLHESVSLNDCFRNFVKPEVLDHENLWYCSKCQNHRQARKTMEIWRLPDVLVLSLKRFEYRNDVLRDKLDMYVDFPLEGLDMSPYCLEKSNDKDGLSYDLFAVSNHYGSMGFGHYTAFAKSWKDGDGELYPGWYSFDDSLVTPAMPNQVKSNAAYILFYKRKNLQVEPTFSVASTNGA
ncbi:hypothetical protein CCR75_002676 [Bremia lactucae]|uniref:Ubiquitin carboxyl-terminal hydrolase n=1 Tax=Bremia lactucae TaxID=4779 RepID=A0A976NXK2_BRELC|nr:hypothetical protein CCR75_002676 [Bremia lactucae]